MPLWNWIADYRQHLETLPVMAGTAPGEIPSQLPAMPPEHPEPFEAILADLDRVSLPGLSLWQHPRFFGYFPAIPHAVEDGTFPLNISLGMAK